MRLDHRGRFVSKRQRSLGTIVSIAQSIHMMLAGCLRCEAEYPVGMCELPELCEENSPTGQLRYAQAGAG